MESSISTEPEDTVRAVGGHDVPADPGPAKTDEPKPAEAPSLATEFDSIAPDLTQGGTVTIGESDIHLDKKRTPGVEVKMHRVRIRQLLAIGRTLTGSSRPVNLYQMIVPIVEAENRAQQYAASTAAFAQLIVTVPHSENEFINLVNTLIQPVDKLNRDESDEFWTYMENPDPEDVIKILAQTTVNERDRAVELGKSLISLFPNLGNETEEPSSET